MSLAHPRTVCGSTGHPSYIHYISFPTSLYENSIAAVMSDDTTLDSMNKKLKLNDWSSTGTQPTLTIDRKKVFIKRLQAQFCGSWNAFFTSFHWRSDIYMYYWRWWRFTANISKRSARFCITFWGIALLLVVASSTDEWEVDAEGRMQKHI